MVLGSIGDSITNFGNTIINWISGIFSAIGDVFLVIYTFLLMITFFALQIGFIYVYFKLGQMITKIIPKIKDWFDLNKDRFSDLLDRK